MVRRCVLQMIRSGTFRKDVIGGFTLAKCCCGQFTFDGADRRGWRYRCTRIVIL